LKDGCSKVQTAVVLGWILGQMLLEPLELIKKSIVKGWNSDSFCPDL
jgi:hypothetical protein